MKSEIANMSEKLDTLMSQRETEDEVDEYVIRNATIKFEAEHEECVRVLPYLQNGDVEIYLYVYTDRFGIPAELKNAAQAFFGQNGWKLIWADLYNDAFNLLKVTSIEYSSGEPKRLEASKVIEIDEIINKHLHVFSKHRNVTAVQPSFKVTDSVQTQEACIVVYVLGKGQIPLGESAIPSAIGSYPVDIANGFCVRATDWYEPTQAHEQKEFLRLGASIGVNGKESSGTLGAIVEDVNSGTLYALSCDHVMNDADEREIIHPGLDVYLDYLRYHLGEYKGWVERTIEPAVELPQFPDDMFEEAELQKMFSDLKTLKENCIASEISRVCVSESRLNQIQFYENKLEEAFGKRPRVIAKYSAGVRSNVRSEKSNGKEHFIDAAIAELNKDEVINLKAERDVVIIGTARYPSGECISATTDVKDVFKSGSTTGLTQSSLLAGASQILPTYIPDFGPNGNSAWIDVECIRCNKKGKARSQVQDLLGPCEQCKPERWLKSCLCFQQQGVYSFSAKGDCGAVIFEKRRNQMPSPGFGIIFAELPSQYFKYTIALPLEIALEALSEKVSKSRPNNKPCLLRLASSFD